MRSARTLLLIVLGVMLVTTIVGAAGRDQPPPPRDRDATARSAPVRTVVRTLELGAGRSEPVRARTDRPLRLTVTGAGGTDVVLIPDLDQYAQISPELPAVFDLLPDRPGSFPVRLQSTDEQVGTLRIRAGE